MIVEMHSIGLTRKALNEIAAFVNNNPPPISQVYGYEESLRIVLDSNGDTIYVILPDDKVKRVSRFAK